MADIKTWREDDSGQPKFPSDFKVVKKAVLQVTDLKTNRNKYYAIEIHEAKGKYRVYTHYGRTDDLETNPRAGMRECRYCDSAGHAEQVYSKIYKQKTGTRKGYKEVNLASSKIGSAKAVGQSSGEMDAKTLKKMTGKSPVKKQVSVLHPEISNLVSYLYSEAVHALTTTVNVSITANGIETPLGVLTLGQIDKGQAILDQINYYISAKKKGSTVTGFSAEVSRLTSAFYTAIPHRIGRSRNLTEASVIDTDIKVAEKQDTLQLMRDMLNVNGDTNVLLNPEIDKKYKALNCTIDVVDPVKAKSIIKYMEKSQLNGSKIKVKHLWYVARQVEHVNYASHIGNEKLLFHGSSVPNWVGILSRGLLLPKSVVKLGIHRTDEGWLGHGIYFGNALCTSYNYAEAGSRDTSFIACVNVALGKIKQYEEITYGLKAPPQGYDSCHGVRDTEFDDDEFVIYNEKQQKLMYLAECSD